MSIETGTVIASFQKQWPRSDDGVSEGDDHLRLIKVILQAQFPGAAGNGFAKTIDASEDEINYLQGVTSNIQDQLGALDSKIDSERNVLNAPISTVLIMYDKQVPPGWEVTHYGKDYMIRIIDPDLHDDAVGGFDSPIQMYGGHLHSTSGHVLTVEEMPSHNHEYGPVTVDDLSGFSHVKVSNNVSADALPDTGSTGGGGSHNHGDTSVGGVDWYPRYLPAVVCVRT